VDSRRRDLAPARGWRRSGYEIIFEHDTPAGRAFDVALLVAIALSVAAVMLETVAEVRARWGAALLVAEWSFTVLFTAEYALRLLCVRRPAQYARSFFGVVDLLAVLPTYLSLLVPGSQSLAIVRGLRLLRVFRVLKLPEYLGQASLLTTALRGSRQKISVFLLGVTIIVLLVGALMYLVEGPEHGFTSIPTSVYWAVVTLTTVGYGDIAPQTTVGRVLAVAVMLTGYGIIAVPTGIVTAEMIAAERSAAAGGGAGRAPRPPCPGCGGGGHDADARHCKHCGVSLS
jgi:voltage-gated potassium channel